MKIIRKAKFSKIAMFMPMFKFLNSNSSKRFKYNSCDEIYPTSFKNYRNHIYKFSDWHYIKDCDVGFRDSCYIKHIYPFRSI